MHLVILFCNVLLNETVQSNEECTLISVLRGVFKLFLCAVGLMDRCPYKETDFISIKYPIYITTSKLCSYNLRDIGMEGMTEK